MEKKLFQAESKRLLDLMIHSIYTHKEIFLRELISNGSDAMDKLHYLSLTDETARGVVDKFQMKLTVDPEKRELILSDTGIGMTLEELEANLGTIAKSGSLQFKEEMTKAENHEQDTVDIIGQFGVGFYSAFMVSKKVTVITKAYNSDQAYCWESEGADGYTITPCEKDGVGTTIIMTLLDDTEEEKYSEYLETYKLKSLVKKYSDYVRYPIVMDVEKSRPIEKEEADENEEIEYETYVEEETLNSMIPIWQRSRSEVSDEDCNQYYKEKFYDHEDPILTLRVNAEGAITYKAMLFIPSHTPYGYYTKEFEKGLQLYSSGVMIMDKCADLLPEHFRFVKGIVDSQDLSLNISRELLQHDRQLKVIASNIEKKIKSELQKLMKNHREKYEQFFGQFGLQLKYGVVSDFGMHKETLQDLLLFHSSTENKLVSLKEYVERMKEDQPYIYYACGESVKKIDQLPQTEPVREKGYEMLYLVDDIDEFVFQTLMKYADKEFKSINGDDLGLESDADKKQMEEQIEENKDLLTFVKEALKDSVHRVILSKKLKSHPVCLSSDSPISLEMEKYFKAMPGEATPDMKAERVLELNPNHAVFTALQDAYKNDQEKAKKYAEILYYQALLIADISLEDPARYTDLVCELMK
ncbi:MAG TPA: molecular chaperone HtpG [Firmicutes bacterium]|nr:molecular chaperone HtpG [Bacillota bacterium]